MSSGLMNKQVAAEMGLAEITVKIHRGHVMKKDGRALTGRPGEDGRSSRRAAHKILVTQINVCLSDRGGAI